ncbi:MAG: terminase family protein, partial [Deltaproteobacteria bacterium]|nr:terminase family protein [Deltaproteobacteria bacterium]
MRAKYGDTPTPGNRYATPAVGVCEFASGPVPVAPYVLGVLLGDGGLTHGVTITSADASVLDAVRTEVERFGGALVHRSRYDYNAIRAAALKDQLRLLDVLGHGSATKRVPHRYLWNSAEVRLAVLQGLMDTDGTCEKSGNTSFTSISKGLAEDVLFLARSFGGKAYIKSRVPKYTHRGEKKVGKRAYTAVIRLPHVPIFRLDRKLARYIRPTSTTDHNLIVAFRDVEPAEAVCISVAHPSQLYVTRDFIVTHNTLSASREVAMHATGLYPSWWPGAMFRKPTVGWAASITSQGTRDSVQRMLLGLPGSWGTGAIPKAMLIPDGIKKAAHGVADSVETITVKHIPFFDNPHRLSDGTSRITLKSYDQGRERWQGDTLNWIWFDEEPEKQEIYTEGLTRTNATGGIAFMTFTPLLGMSDVVRRFLIDKAAGTHVTTMTIEDALHYTPEQRKRIVAAYPSHERDARAKGIPILGSGRIFPFEDAMVAEPPLQIPNFWPRGAGLDFGYDHPFAVVWGTWDRDTDTIHIYDCYKKRESAPAVNAVTIRSKGLWIPVFWPHDGETRDSRGSGITHAQQYRDMGVNMFRERATHAPAKGQKEGDGGISLENGLTLMFDRIQTGRLKVAKHLVDWFDEFRLYHREDGLVVRKNDDLMSATLKLLMMVRH